MGQRQASDRHEQRVARGVAALVVDALEVVDVDNEQAQRRAEPFRVDELARQLFLEGTVVAELREAVEERVRSSASVELEQVGVLPLERLDTTDDRRGHQREHERQRQRDERQQQDDEHARARSVRPQAQDREHADEHDELQHDQGDDSSPDREPPLGQRGRFDCCGCGHPAASTGIGCPLCTRSRAMRNTGRKYHRQLPARPETRARGRPTVRAEPPGFEGCC